MNLYSIHICVIYNKNKLFDVYRMKKNKNYNIYIAIEC